MEYLIKNNIVLFQKGPLSNWYGAYKGQENGRFRMQGIDFNCAEQAMMYYKAQQFNDDETASKILKELNPKAQKELGRGVKGYNEDVWSAKRFRIVSAVLCVKFAQNKDLKNFLRKDLKNYIIAEAAPWDKIWGIGLGPEDPKAWDVKTWEGENLLGKALMLVRDLDVILE